MRPPFIRSNHLSSVSFCECLCVSSASFCDDQQREHCREHDCERYQDVVTVSCLDAGLVIDNGELVSIIADHFVSDVG